MVNHRLRAWIAVAALAILPVAAIAQMPATSDGIRLTPYLWNAGFEGTLGVGGGGGARVDAEFSGLLDNLEIRGFMLNGEWRKGPVFIAVDYARVKLRSSAPSPLGVLHSGAEGEIDGEIAQSVFGVRLSGDASPGLELLLGARAYFLEGRLTLQPGAVAARYLAQSAEWTDLIAGARWQRPFAGNWTVSLYGDVGAGESDKTWQAVASLGYGFKRGSIVGGWRHLYVDYDKPVLKIDAALSGPFLGASLRF